MVSKLPFYEALEMEALSPTLVQAAITATLCTNQPLLLQLREPGAEHPAILCELWMQIFIRIYGESPQNTPDTPAYYAPGVTDPRWDVLLHRSGGLRIFAQLCAPDL